MKLCLSKKIQKMTHGIKDSEAHVSFQCSIVLKYRTVQTIAVFGLLSNLGLESAFYNFNFAIGKTEYLEFKNIVQCLYQRVLLLGKLS